MTLPDAIRTARLSAGLTQRELASIACISKQHIAFIEQGRRVGSPVVLRHIGDALGVNLRRTYYRERRRLQRRRRWPLTTSYRDVVED